MVELFKLYLPKSHREVKIWVSGPRNKENIIFDTFYLLDGQNAFKDSHAAFGRSIRATKCLGNAAKKINKRILGIAIENSGSDLGRINEYTPFKIEHPASDEWKKQDITVCKNFCDDFIHTIIPFIESKYKTYESDEHRFIYGSSLAAITALYLGFNYKNSFKYIGAFSTASFLFEDEFMKFLNKKSDTNKDVFLYVGEQEESDDCFTETIYLDSSIILHDFFKSKGNRVKLIIDSNGHHNEETWGNHLQDFINFIYFDTIEYINR